jgi:hypothetical protein
VRLAEIGEKDRVEVILTNPPFGSEEEAGILMNFPEDRRTSETALLFLQLIMRRLKRGGRGQAGVVVPHGVLFADGVAARIKADLLALPSLDAQLWFDALQAKVAAVRRGHAAVAEELAQLLPVLLHQAFG